MAHKQRSPWRRTTGSHGLYAQTFDAHYSNPSHGAKHQRQAANRLGWTLVQSIYPDVRNALLADVPEATLRAALTAAVELAMEVRHGG